MSVIFTLPPPKYADGIYYPSSLGHISFMLSYMYVVLVSSAGTFHIYTTTYLEHSLEVLCTEMINVGLVSVALSL